MNAIPAETTLWGARVPAFYGMAADRGFYSVEQQYGRPALLLLVGAQANGALAPVLAGLAPHLPAFAARDADMLVVVDDNPTRVGTGTSPFPIRVVDAGGFLQRCGVGPQDMMALLLDRALRVAVQSWPTRQTDVVARCLAALNDLPFEPPHDVGMPAPVIVLPNLIAPELCRQLIELFDNSPSIEGEVARVDASGRTRSVVDHDKKNRRDMMIAPDSDLHRMLHGRLLERCRPEIARAFQAVVSHTDRILIARYDESGGWFRRHRDNTAAHVAFREFALSLNLNTEAFEGGHLVFPEYSDHRHRPPTGAGVIFSTAVLHEATPVTSGCRYVLLTFFHGDAAEARRLAHLAEVGEAGG